MSSTGTQTITFDRRTARAGEPPAAPWGASPGWTSLSVVEPPQPPTLVSTSFARSITNQRVLRVRVRVHRRSTIAAEVTRDGRSLGRVEVGPVVAGSRLITIPIARGAVAGDARLVLGVKALGGDTRPLSKSIRIPARILT